MKIMDIQLIQGSVNVNDVEAAVTSPDAGGTVVFIGTVRNQTQSKKVLRLEFEAYKPMALKELEKIGNDIKEKWDALAISIHHGLGVLQIEEVAVAIAIACPHRKAAFEACAYAIDTLKETVPIWKKEYFEDGEVWVAAHP